MQPVVKASLGQGALMFRRLLFVCLLAAAGANGAHADSVTATRAWANCEGGAGIWSELRVSGCNEVIKSGKASGSELARAHYNRANAYLAKGEYQVAIADYDRALEIDPEDADALSERCWARAVIGTELDAALSDCNEALRIKPNDNETLGARGFTYIRLEFYRTAILDYDAALNVKSDNAQHLFARGTAKLRAGEEEGGNADIAAAKAIDPKIEATFARYDQAGETSFWAATIEYWRSVMRWMY